MTRVELFLATLCCIGWAAVILALLDLLPLAGLFDLDLYRFYSVAAILGWVAGNVYVFRLRTLVPQRYRQRFLFLYLIGPPSFLYLLRACASTTAQQAAPFVPLYSFVVYGIFFLVPITFGARHRPSA